MITDYFQNIIAGSVFHASDSPGSIPDVYYLGVSTTPPNASGGNVTEPSSSAGYERVQIAGLKMKEGVNGVVTNIAAISTSEATSSWGSIPYYVVYDAKSGGNLLGYGAFSDPKTVEASSMLTMKAGTMTLTVKNLDQQ